MKPRQARAQPPHLPLAERGLDAGKDFILFQAHVVVEELAERGQLPLDVSLRSQGGGQALNATTDGGVLGQHPQHGGLVLERNVASEGGQQHFFFFAEVQPSGGLPEPEVVAGGAAQRGRAVARRLAGGAADEKRLHQRVVVVLAERMQAGVTLHRPRWYYFFRVRT